MHILVELPQDIELSLSIPAQDILIHKEREKKSHLNLMKRYRSLFVRTEVLLV